MLTSKSKFIWSEKSKINYNTLVYIINEFYNHVGHNKERMIAFGEQIGPRIYESINFQREKPTKRFVTLRDAMAYLSQNVTIHLKQLALAILV